MAWRDAVYAFRVLAKHPMASGTAVLSLAIGIGLNSTVYSVVSGVLWRSLPFVDSEHLVSIGSVTPSEPRPADVRDRLFLDLRERSQTLDSIGAFDMSGITIVAPGEPTQIACPAITAGLFEVLRVRPLLGRVFSPADYEAAHTLRVRADPSKRPPLPAVVLLSDSLWRSRFNGDRAALGSSMTVAGGDRLQIVGVMGPEMESMGIALPGQCWVPDVADRAEPLQEWRRVIGRLRPDRSIAELNAELTVIGGLPETDYATKELRTLRAIPVIDGLVGDVRTQLLFLFGAVVCVLLVTCANVVNLFLAHAAGRRNELATRVALGASRSRLIRQSLTESLILSLLGGARRLLSGGVGAARAGVAGAAPHSAARRDRCRLVHVRVHAGGVGRRRDRLRGARGDCRPTQAPRAVFGSVQAATTPRTARLRHAVTVCEIALALMLAVAVVTHGAHAAGVERDRSRLRSARRRVCIAAVAFHRASRGPGPPCGDRRTREGAARGAGGRHRTWPAWHEHGARRHHAPGDSRDLGMVNVDAVSPGYFEALGARLLAGRFFDTRDASRDQRRSSW